MRASDNKGTPGYQWILISMLCGLGSYIDSDHHSLDVFVESVELYPGNKVLLGIKSLFQQCIIELLLNFLTEYVLRLTTNSRPRMKNS